MTILATVPSNPAVLFVSAAPDAVVVPFVATALEVAPVVSLATAPSDWLMTLTATSVAATAWVFS